MRPVSLGHTGRALLGFLLVGMLGLALSGRAEAAEAPPLLWQSPPEGVTSGSAAGEFRSPSSVASSPFNDELYVADRGNARVEEFDPWGVFIRAWGWGVRDGSPEPQVCTAATGCQEGIAGNGAGQFNGMSAIAVDPASGAVYVSETARLTQGELSDNYRVQKFDAEGDFEWMIGGGVNQGPLHPGNLCTAQNLQEGDVCGPGEISDGQGEFDAEVSAPLALAVDSSGMLYVGSKGRIQVFDPAGAYQSEIELPEGETNRGVRSLAFGAPGVLYMDFENDTQKEEPEKPFIYRHTLSGWEQFAEVVLPENDFHGPIPGLPADSGIGSNGDVYVKARERSSDKGIWEEVVSFGPDGACVLCPEVSDFAKFTVEEGALVGLAVGAPCGVPSDDVYVLNVRYVVSFGETMPRLTAYGPPPDANLCPPPAKPPTILSQYATAATGTAATVAAEINPHFWPDTTYYVEYGTGRCSEGGCDQKRPLPPGATLTSKTIDAVLKTGGVLLPDLTPATTYHYRFVAQSSGGGPVYGTGPEPTPQAGGEGTFTTRGPALQPKADCPNQAYRTGPAAFLADCRAYEQVSPEDKNNGDILQMGDINGYPAGMDQAAPEGEKLTYGTYRAFGDAQGAPYTSQYVASRTAGGWTSHDVSPPRGVNPVLGEGNTLQTTFRAFSADLCQGWLMQDTDPVLAPGAVEGYANLYRSDLCGPGGYEALTTSPPPGLAPKEFVPELQGVTADGRKALFVAAAKLTPNAAPGTRNQLYAAVEGSLELVSVLPDGTPCAEKASVGTGNESTGIRTETVLHAMSADGSRVYWSCAGKHGLYLRLEGEAKSRLIAPENARFWTASPDGARMIYTVNGSVSFGGKLFSFDAETRKSTQIAAGVLGVAATSEDASRIYFASGDVLTGEEANQFGARAEAGKPNLYLYEEGAGSRFIGTLAAGDLIHQFSALPVKHAARATPDGSHMAFVSTAPLTGFDNADVQSGSPAAEVYLYDAESNELRCVSCNPTGIRPAARNLEEKTGGTYLAAARLTPASSQLYQPRYLSDDGRGLFFESYESLVPRDTDGVGDVYEFEPGGPQRCAELGAETYDAPAEGCLSLVSSGESPKDSEFVDASADGRDVFFTTASSLLAQDSGLIDIYDAREGGGFPPPPTPRVQCEGEACQSPYTPPADPTPASSSFQGAGNVPPQRRARRHHRHRRHHKPRHRRRHPAGTGRGG
jgi:hypothetical protein